jgi:hypothetical protein
MPPAHDLTQDKAQQRHGTLAMLGALVLGVHLWLLWAPGIDIWKIEAESQKLGPLQTRMVPAPISAEPRPPAQALAQTQSKPKPILRPPQASMSPNTLPPANITALPSEALPAPEANAIEVSATEAAPKQASAPAPNPVPEIGIAATSPPLQPAQPIQPVTEVPPIAAETSLPMAQATPPASNALTAKTGDFPPSTQINYKLVGQERGLIYNASGSLKWQAQAANDKGLPRAYEAELQVKAFLVGSRVWRSTGSLTDNGLAPLRYSDRWRGERAAHFETANQKISFSGNMPSAPLQAGAQDQLSLFIQMAAAVTAKNYAPGSQLMVQTATTRDAVNWTITFQSTEEIVVDGKKLETQRWVCLPRGKYDSQIELWLSPAHGGLPLRIKISQVNGNFIDMEMRNTENLPALPS